MGILINKNFGTRQSFLVGSVVVVILFFCNTGCVNQKKNSADVAVDSAAMQREADSLFVTIEELARMTPAVKEKRKAGIILSKYVSLKGDTYSLDISKEEGRRLGVKENVYDEIRRDVENTNSIIRKLKADGISVDLVDVKEEAEKADSVLETNRN